MRTRAPTGTEAADSAHTTSEAVSRGAMRARIRAMDETLTSSDAAASSRRVWLYLLPIAIFAGIGVLLYQGLFRDPTLVPSPLIGKPVPEFALGPVPGRTDGLSSQDLHGGRLARQCLRFVGCVACRDEHPLLMALEREEVVPIHGLNYKDVPDDAAAWLGALGDPYARIGADIDGRVGLDWGVYGVPETFVVDRDGRIAYKHIGPVTPKVLDEVLLPLVRDLRSRS